MRKVNLNMNEEYKYEVIKKLVETGSNKNTVALKLKCSKRHVNRMVAGYREHGKDFFRHGNRNRKPVHAISEDERKRIVNLYLDKYPDANFSHFKELLDSIEGINVSKSTVRAILMGEDIVSPMSTRKIRRRLREKLFRQNEKGPSNELELQIQDRLVEPPDAHPRRPRKAHFGELIQMDASLHLWFGSEKTQLHIAVDDSTGHIVAAFFDKQETLFGYYNLLKQILEGYGIPYEFLTDRRTVFEYACSNDRRVEKDTSTQFGYACKQLGIGIRTSSVPQAKGRVERMFQTLQSRLPIELRLKGATTIEQANEFLHSYVKEFNALFALPIDYTTSVFESSPSKEKINLTLSVLAKRQIDCGHCIRFENSFYRPVDASGLPIYYRKGTSCMVIHSFDGNLFASVDDNIHALDYIPEREHVSSEFSAAPDPEKHVERYVPAMTHPWKLHAFTDYVASLGKYYDKQLPSFLDMANSQEVFY